jgi:DtxR family Mn-dependent transcriptional regulator
MLSGKEHRELSPSHEHYLRAVLQVRSARGYARQADVARELGVAPPTLSVGLRSLEARGLVTQDDRHFLTLTPEGEGVARAVHHRFTVISTFLKDLLGLPEKVADADACRLEHGLSEAATDRLVDLVKLARDDAQAREFFVRHFAAYHRECGPGPVCPGCELECLSEEKGGA